jgi:hypothetical protein
MSPNYTPEQIAKMDAEMRELQALYSKARIRIGLELASRLVKFYKYKLYLKLDEQSYPTFPRYLESLDIKYTSAREVMGLYESYVETAGMTMAELAGAEYHKLTTVKKMCFEYKNGQYQLTASKSELKKWVAEASSDITQEDLRQKVRDEIAGKHEHDWEEIGLRVCKICKLKERIK